MIRIQYVPTINDNPNLAGLYVSSTQEIYVARVGVEQIAKDYGISEDDAFDIVATHEMQHLKRGHHFYAAMPQEERFLYEHEAWFYGRSAYRDRPELLKVYDTEHIGILTGYGKNILGTTLFISRMEGFELMTNLKVPALS